MATIRPPKTVAAATKLCERFAELECEIGQVEAQRQAAIAEANVAADTVAQPLLEERAAIEQKLSAWWPANAASLTDGRRKSIELGGCLIGSRSGKETLSVGDAKAAAGALLLKRWGRALVTTTVNLNRAAILAALAGPHGEALEEIGFGKVPGAEAFVLKRAEQGGTLAGATS